MKAVRQGRGVTGLLMLLALAGCSSRSAEPPPPNPDEVRAKIVRLMPATVRDRQGWASDIYAAFSAQQIYPSDENLCAVLAVTEQESTYQVDPPVAGLGRIATREVERRAGKLHVPAFLVSSALNIKSPDGRTYSQRLAAARTEKELSETFDDFIAIVPMGGKLFGGFNPVRTRTAIPIRWTAASAARCSAGAAACISASPTCLAIRRTTRRRCTASPTSTPAGMPVATPRSRAR